MTRAMKWLTVAAAVSSLVAAGCGGDDDEDNEGSASGSASSPQACIDSWNAEENQGHQTSMAGIVSAVGLAPDKWRVGTWPGAEQTVPVSTPEDAFAEPRDKATVTTGSCLIAAPESHVGDLSFFEADGEWHLVKQVDDGSSKFPPQARKKIAQAETATADALGKLTLN
jgi:hypothetical protein